MPVPVMATFSLRSVGQLRHARECREPESGMAIDAGCSGRLPYGWEEATPVGVASVTYRVLRRVMPASPTMPEPSSQAAGGNGTALTCTLSNQTLPVEAPFG